MEICNYIKIRISKLNELYNNTHVKETDQHIPIVFINTPISNYANDVIGINSSAESIKIAAENNAKMVGVIAQYGAGKSSLTETLSKDKKCFGKAIHINMWDSISKMPVDKNSSQAISSLTKSFIFQMASGISENAAKHVNHRLSKNYGIISFSISSKLFWIWTVLASIAYIVFAVIADLSIYSIEKIVAMVGPDLAYESIYPIACIIKGSAPLFMVIGIALIILGLRKTSVAFSNWKAQSNREPEVNDVFESYFSIYKKLLSWKHHRLIIVEDLDRINDKKLVIGFLKEIYRFSSLPPKHWRKEPVFVISVMPESHLDKKDESDNEEVYSKIFDYTVVLKPIHYSDYGDIVLSIIGDKQSSNRIRLQNLLEEKDRIVNDQLPKSFDWLIKGHNLTIRQLKDRLNSAVSLLVNLKYKGYTNQSYISFSSCSAVTYLEFQYPKLFTVLLEQEDNLSKLVQMTYSIKNEGKSDTADKVTSAAEELLIKIREKNEHNSNYLIADLVEMLLNGDVSDDFRMYFYSFPKNSYIKNGDERDICNLLLLPNDYSKYEELDEKIAHIIISNKDNIIIDVLKNIGDDINTIRYPEVILWNQYLFKKSCEINNQKVERCIEYFASWSEKRIKRSQQIIEKIFSYKDESFNTLLKKYAYWLSNHFFDIDDKSKIDIRKHLISISGKNILIFKGLYIKESGSPKFYVEPTNTCSEFVLITEDELLAIPSIETSLELINTDLINQENYTYIVKFMNKEIIIENSRKTAMNIFKNIIKVIPATLVWQEIIQFLKINELVDDEMLLYAISGISEDRMDKVIISQYLNSLSPDCITEKYLILMDENFIDVDISDDVVILLYEHKLFVALLSYLSNSNNLNRVDFTIEESIKLIVSACDKILKYNVDLIPLIRKEIIIQFVKNEQVLKINEVYSDLFYNEYPLISKDEIETLPDAVEILRLMNREKITANNFEEIVDTINKKSHPSQCYDLLYLLLSNEYVDKYNDETIVVNIINRIDYQKIEFNNLLLDNAEAAIKLIGVYIDFTNYQNANDFMLKTNCLIPSLEKVVVASNAKLYINTITQIDNPSESTINWLVENDVNYALPANTLNELLKLEKYNKYLVGKVLFENSFVFPFASVPEEVVMEEYTVASPIWEKINSNPSLVNCIISKELYKNFDESEFPTVLIPLYSGKQTSKFAEFILTHLSKEEQLDYLQNMGEIVDEENSVSISRILVEEEHIDLLRDDKIFYIVQSRLWENTPSHLGYKSTFTRKRNKRLGKK